MDFGDLCGNFIPVDDEYAENRINMKIFEKEVS